MIIKTDFFPYYDKDSISECDKLAYNLYEKDNSQHEIILSFSGFINHNEIYNEYTHKAISMLRRKKLNKLKKNE